MLARKRSATASAVPEAEPPLSATRFALFAGLVAIPRPWPWEAPAERSAVGGRGAEPSPQSRQPHSSGPTGYRFPYTFLSRVMGILLLASPGPGFLLQKLRGRKRLFSFSPLGSLTVHLHVHNLSRTSRRMFLTQQPPG